LWCILSFFYRRTKDIKDTEIPDLHIYPIKQETDKKYFIEEHLKKDQDLLNKVFNLIIKRRKNKYIHHAKHFDKTCNHITAF